MYAYIIYVTIDNRKMLFYKTDTQGKADTQAQVLLVY